MTRLELGCVVVLLAATAGCRSQGGTARADTGTDGATAAQPSAAGATRDGCILMEDSYGPEGQVPLRVETVVEGLEVPWGVAFLPDGDLLVTERPGRVRRVSEGRLVEQPVAEIEAADSDEGGLLGLALHPDFASNRLFYLYYTRRADGAPVNRVERWRLSEDGRTARADRVILDDIPAAKWHDGGRIAFGPDGLLYVATGDATNPDLSQDRGSPAGKLLRLDPDGGIPGDNPFPDSPVWLLGLRNLQAFDWRDAETLVVADHGPSGELGRRGHDEVTVARKGENLGWPTLYGCETREGLRTPALTWRQAAPPGGGLWYTGDALPEWKDSFLVATLGSRHLHRVAFDGRRVARHEVYLDGAHGRLRTVLQGPDGAVYVTTSNCDGRARCPRGKDRILRIVKGG